MAHTDKYTTGQAGRIFNHNGDKKVRDKQEHIDHDRTKDNYNLMEREESPKEYFEKRLGEVYCLDRADVKTCFEWVVTLPQGWQGDSREFFCNVVDFLNDRYGAENCIGAWVHKDEHQDHLHYASIPIVKDHNPNHEQAEKVCAKEVLTKQELREFHPALQEFLKERMPDRGEKEIQVYGIEKERIKNRSLKEYKTFKDEQRADRREQELRKREKEQESRDKDINERKEQNRAYERYFSRVDQYCRDMDMSRGEYFMTCYNAKQGNCSYPAPERINPDRTEQERREMSREVEHEHNREHEHIR